jgi:Ser/Thr protein kinase RdoA (MazF antagonist)
VRRASRNPWPWRWRPIHRDFYHDQVLAGEHGISILDFDDAAMSEPALDVANFLAHLRLLALEEREATEDVARVAAAFSASYRELDADLDPALVRFLEGATLLRLAGIHLQRSGELLSDRLLAHSEQLLR